MATKNLIRLLLVTLALSSCRDGLWNNPHSEARDANVIYSSFSSQPKTLDPAKAYSADSYEFINQIYEPPLQYSYFAKPYRLEPLAAISMPKITKLDIDGNEIDDDNQEIAYTRYDIIIKPNQFYQNHPAFSKDKDNNYLYHNLGKNLSNYFSMNDFKNQSTREVTAYDFVYEIKRIASPELNSPILSMMAKHIVGLQELSNTLQQDWHKGQYLDLNKYKLSGVEAHDRYNYSITLYGEYPQFSYWLTMPFFAPIPWEADKFYSQPGMLEKNFTLGWYPVGSGPFFLSKNDPNSLMILRRNNNFHGETFPKIEKNDPNYEKFKTLEGKKLPLVDELILSLEKENIPYWYKFMQGYYDSSTISSDNFDQAIQISPDGEMELTPAIKKQGIKLKTSISPSIFYLGFNMLDKKIGGDSEKNRLLRQAISIAIDYEEYINIFLNGRGVAAQSNIPPGIFGGLDEKTQYNPYTYNKEGKLIKKKSIQEAKNYLKLAGYENGIDKETGKPLILYLDTVGSSPNDKAQANWYRKQLNKIGIDLYIVNTSWNRFQEKIRTGSAQMYILGWNADYPDPENFLFLLYGPNGKVKFSGENVSNFSDPEFDKLFDRMKNLPNNEERAEIIAKMTNIIQKQAPWAWGFFPKNFTLSHIWNGPTATNPMANNALKYASVDGPLRKKLQDEWNKPQKVVLFVIGIMLLLLIIPARAKYRKSTLNNQIKRF